MLDNWMKDAEGNISILPLVGWEIGPAMGMAVIARLEFRGPADAPDKLSAAQTILTPIQAIELGQALLRNAERVLAEKPEGAPS